MQRAVFEIAKALNGKSFTAAEILAACGYLATSIMASVEDADSKRRMADDFIATVRKAMNMQATVTPLRVVSNTSNTLN